MAGEMKRSQVESEGMVVESEGMVVESTSVSEEVETPN